MSQQETKNAVLTNSMNVLYSLSFYAPIIISVSIIVFSMFTSTIGKSFVFFLWIFVITFIRILIFKGIDMSNKDNKQPFLIPDICLTGITEIFIPKDVTYSTYILSFSLMYFIMPMIMVSIQNNINAINYGVLGFFIAYIMLDVFIKHSLLCIPSFLSSLVIGNIISGLFLGALISGIIMYGSTLKTYLYINEINTNIFYPIHSKYLDICSQIIYENTKDNYKLLLKIFIQFQFQSL